MPAAPAAANSRRPTDSDFYQQRYVYAAVERVFFPHNEVVTWDEVLMYDIICLPPRFQCRLQAESLAAYLDAAMGCADIPYHWRPVYCDRILFESGEVRTLS